MLTYKVLVVGEDPSLITDIEKTLSHIKSALTEALVLQKATATQVRRLEVQFSLEHAAGISQASNRVQDALKEDAPFPLVILSSTCVDAPDTTQDIANLLALDQNLHSIICTKRPPSDLEPLSFSLRYPDQSLVLRYPFGPTELWHMARTLCSRWDLQRCIHMSIEQLNTLVHRRTESLEKELRTVAELKLSIQESLSRAHATIEATADAILVTDLAGVILTGNKRFYRLFSCTKETMVWTTWSDFLDGIKVQLIQKSSLYKDIERIKTPSTTAASEELLFKDGRCFEMDVNPSTINGVTSGWVYSFSDVTFKRQMELELRYQSTHDLITGCPNRILLIDRLNQQMIKAQRNSTYLALCSFDLDNFKFINDHLGQPIGDRILQEVAQRLIKTAREVDTVARISGDEFLVLISDLKDPSDVNHFLKRTEKALQELFSIDDYQLHLTASIGVSLFPGNGDSSELLIRNADTAMYHAKESGRARCNFYSDEMYMNRAQRLTISQDLFRAIERNEFLLHFQPIISSATNTMSSVEVLLRWKHPTLGWVSPQLFIPIAESSGLITRLGKWVAIEACHQLRQWHDMGYTDLNIAINVSSAQLLDDEIVAVTESILKREKLPASSIELELTETVLLIGTQPVKDTMLKLRNLGVGLSADDFGTGYSSLVYLRDFPVTKLKIDMSFIKEIPKNHDTMQMIKSIIDMAHSLNLPVVAEGVETVEQRDFLRENQCDYFQGYLYSKPLPAEELTLFLAKNSLQKSS